MRIAAFSDPHLAGAGVPGAVQVAWRQEDFLKAFHRVVAEIRDYEPDLILFGGDAFQSRTPSPRWVREFALGLRALSKKAPTCIVPGNHDLTSWGSILDALMVMSDYSNLYYFSDPIAKEINGAQVFGMPWVTAKHLAGWGTDANQRVEDLACAGIRALLAQPFDGPRIFVGHLTMLGGEFGGFVPVTMGKEIFWQSSWLGGFDAALLGHLHRHQFPDPSRPWICYAGSTERLNFGEREEEKGWVSIDLAEENPGWEFHPISVRPMIQIEMDAGGTEMFFPDVPQEAILKVVLRLGAGQPAPDIRADCKYLLPPTFIRGGQERQFRGAKDITEMTVVDQLLAYWKSREISEERIETFMGYAKELMADVEAV